MVHFILDASIVKAQCRRIESLGEGSPMRASKDIVVSDSSIGPFNYVPKTQCIEVFLREGSHGIGNQINCTPRLQDSVSCWSGHIVKVGNLFRQSATGGENGGKVQRRCFPGIFDRNFYAKQLALLKDNNWRVRRSYPCTLIQPELINSGNKRLLVLLSTNSRLMYGIGSGVRRPYHLLPLKIGQPRINNYSN